MTRIKEVHTADMVAHLWANQSQERARHGNHGHQQLYFEGREIYSYGHHYMAGRIMPDGTALVNADSNSKTTNGLVWTVWGSVSHRTRYRIPGLTDLARAWFHYVEDGDRQTKLRGQKGVLAYVAEHALALPEHAGEYLLKYAGHKNVKTLAAKLRKEATRAAEKEKADAEKATRKDLLDYGAKTAKLAKSERALVAGLANVLAGHDGQVRAQATKLHKAHRALKAAKRENQAAEVWRVLKLVRAEIALREKQNERKSHNAHTKSDLKTLRAGMAALRAAFANNACISSHELSALQNGAERLAGNSNIPASVKPRLVAIAEFTDAAYELVRAQEKAEAEREAAENIAAWLRGERTGTGYSSGLYTLDRTLLRAMNVTRDETGTITGGTLETSKGADVPLLHALRAFRFLKLVRDRAAVPLKDGDAFIDTIAWERNGHSLRVGQFAIDTIWASGNFRAGCHKVTWQEVERLARELGVFNDAPSDEALTPSHVAA